MGRGQRHDPDRSRSARGRRLHGRRLRRVERTGALAHPPQGDPQGLSPDRLLRQSSRQQPRAALPDPPARSGTGRGRGSVSRSGPRAGAAEGDGGARRLRAGR